MSKNVRVRFAPSPTGPLHIGGVRTALYNYLFAKKHGGIFILRIEDTDQKRYVSNAEKYIIEALEWSGIPYDEGLGKEAGYGPYRQSERKEIYQKYADELIKIEKAYYAFDTPEELNQYRSEYEKRGETFIYNWHNRQNYSNSLNLSKEEVEKRIAKGDNYVIRFKMHDPKNERANEIISTNDIVRGQVTFKKEVLDDKVLYKSDGMPTYHLANIVDDHLMEISHVIRGEEWLPSLPLHIALYQAFGWNIPEFAHLPLLMKPVGKGKLSKRDGDKLGFPVFPLEYTNDVTNEVSRGYREDGYFPEAFINMLAFLGWNPGTEQEVFSLDELIEAFSLERVSKSGAKFDLDKTKWYQQQYMQRAGDSEIAKMYKNVILSKAKNLTNHKDITYITKVVSLIKERATFVTDLWDLGHYFFEAPTAYDPKAAKKAWKEGTDGLMQEVIEVLEKTKEFASENIESNIKKWIQKNELGFGKVLMPFRLCLVGSMQGPHVFDIAAMIGKKETITRIQKAINQLS